MLDVLKDAAKGEPIALIVLGASLFLLAVLFGIGHLAVQSIWGG